MAGCGSFGKVADIWKTVVQKKFKLEGAFRWVDDTLFIKRDNGSNKTSMVEIADLSTEMGVVTNTSKWREFTYTQKYLGFLWDGKAKTVGYDVEKLVGRLYHATLVYQQLRCHCVAMYQLINANPRRLVPRPGVRNVNWVGDATRRVEKGDRVGGNRRG